MNPEQNNLPLPPQEVTAMFEESIKLGCSPYTAEQMAWHNYAYRQNEAGNQQEAIRGILMVLKSLYFDPDTDESSEPA